MATTTRTLAAFDAAITPDTRLVSISHVLWTTGAVMPVARIAALAHARGALVVVDGAQAVGAIPVRFEDLGADLYAIPAQKWLLGPEGMGALVVDPARSRDLVPALAGSLQLRAARRLTGDAAWWPDARRFDAQRLPPAVGRRHGPLDRLAVDVRRARLRPPPRDGDWRPRPRRAWPRSPA